MYSANGYCDNEQIVVVIMDLVGAVAVSSHDFNIGLLLIKLRQIRLLLFSLLH